MMHETQMLMPRHLAVLYGLGRFRLLATRHVWQIWYHNCSLRFCQQQLKWLHEDLGYVWRSTLRHRIGRRRPPPVKEAYVWGLTPAGIEYVAEQVTSTSSLRSRSGDLSFSRRYLLGHDLELAEFMARLISDLRENPRWSGFLVEPEYAGLDWQTGHLRLDAFLVLCFNSNGVPRPDRMPWELPWLDTLDEQPVGQYQVPLAIEIDRSSESLAIIKGKAQRYRDAFLAGRWRSSSGPEYPVAHFVVRSEERLRNVICAWSQGWSPRAPILVASWERLDQSVVHGRWINHEGREVDIFNRSSSVAAPVYGGGQ